MRHLAIIALFFLPLFSSQAQQNTIKEQARVYRDEGYRLQAMGDLDGALQYYQKASQMDPYFAQAYNDVGVIYEAKGDDAAALEMYEKALKIDPKCLSAYSNLALLYERRGDREKAINYWQKRFGFGQQGDYWWAVSRQHLLALGAAPKADKSVLEYRAAMLSKEVLHRRKEGEIKSNEQAKLHFDVGKQAFMERDYGVAAKEFNKALSLSPTDEELKKNIRALNKQSQRSYFRAQAISDTNAALDYIESDEYLAAGEKLKNALTAVFSISQQK